MKVFLDYVGTAKQDFASSLLSQTAALRPTHRADPRQADLYKDILASSFRTWLDEDSRLGQRAFWELFDELQSSKVNFVDLAKLTQIEPLNFEYVRWDLEVIKEFSGIKALSPLAKKHIIVEGPLEAALADSDWVLYHQSFIVDGQHRLQAIFRRDFSRYVSAKATKRALEAALRELTDFNNGSISELIRLVGTTLSRELSGSVKLVVRIQTFLSSGLKGEQTARDKVLNFSIRTGNPPPSTLSRLRSVVDRALVTFNTNARSTINEMLQSRCRSRDLRNSLHCRYSRPRDNRRARENACIDCGAQPPGRWSPRDDRSLAQGA
jgi:hypothetical protein